MPHQSRLTRRSRVRTARAGLHVIVLSSVVGLLSACTGPGTPSPAASLACSNIQGREGGGSDYLDCLRRHGPAAGAYGLSG